MAPLQAGKWKIIVILILLLSACAPGAAEAPTASTLATPTPVEKVPPVVPAAITEAPARTVPATVAPTAVVQPGSTDLANPPPLETAPSDAFLRGPLSVIITSPLENAVLPAAQVDLTGEADPETVISIDDQIVLVGIDRRFSVPLALDEGPNVIEITASDPAGNQGTVFLTVIYDPQP